MWMHAKTSVATMTALALAFVSLACVLSCFGPQAAMPPCHHHAHSCAPLLLTAETPHAPLAAAFIPAFDPSLALETTPQASSPNVFVPLSPITFASPPELAPPSSTVLRI